MMQVWALVTLLSTGWQVSPFTFHDNVQCELARSLAMQSWEKPKFLCVQINSVPLWVPK